MSDAKKRKFGNFIGISKDPEVESEIVSVKPGMRVDDVPPVKLDVDEETDGEGPLEPTFTLPKVKLVVNSDSDARKQALKSLLKRR